MVGKPNAPRGRPIRNKVDRIPASPEHISKAIFKAAENKNVKPSKSKKKPH
jgi:hypothetical protein